MEATLTNAPNKVWPLNLVPSETVLCHHRRTDIRPAANLSASTAATISAATPATVSTCTPVTSPHPSRHQCRYLTRPPVPAGKHTACTCVAGLLAFVAPCDKEHGCTIDCCTCHGCKANANRLPNHW